MRARSLMLPGGATPVEWVTLTSVIASIDGKVATATAQRSLVPSPTIWRRTPAVAASRIMAR